MSRSNTKKARSDTKISFFVELLCSFVYLRVTNSLALQPRFILHRKLQQPVAPLDAQLLAHMRPMVLHCADADEEFFSDLFAGEIIGKKSQDLPLRRGEQLERGNIL